MGMERHARNCRSRMEGFACNCQGVEPGHHLPYEQMRRVRAQVAAERRSRESTVPPFAHCQEQQS
jgi:hypothetical protein